MHASPGGVGIARVSQVNAARVRVEPRLGPSAAAVGPEARLRSAAAYDGQLVQVFTLALETSPAFLARAGLQPAYEAGKAES